MIIAPVYCAPVVQHSTDQSVLPVLFLIYLAAWDLGCSSACEVFVSSCGLFRWGTRPSLVVALELSCLGACGISALQPGSYPFPLHWKVDS